MARAKSPQKSGDGQAPLPSHDAARDSAYSLLSAAGFTLTLTPQDGHFKWTNPDGLSAILALPKNRHPSKVSQFHDLLTTAASQLRQDAIAGLHRDGASYCVTYQVKSFDGQTIWIEERGKRAAGSGPAPNLIYGVLRDVTTEQQAKMRAEQSAGTDSVTGLHNRARFTEALEQDMASVSLRHVPGYAIAIRSENLPDDNFAASQIALAGIGDCLNQMIKPPHQAARIGASTFAICLPGMSQSKAEETAREIITAIAQLPDSAAPITSAVSGLRLDQPNMCPADVLGLLETQLMPSPAVIDFSLPVPQSGFNSLPVFSETDILAILKGRRLALAYQPIIYADTREIHHYECLLRLRASDGSVSSAASLIIAAEKLGYVHLLDQRALEMGLELLKAHPELHLAFNVSAGTVESELAAERYLATLKSLGTDAQRITIELTETLEFEQAEKAGLFAERVKALGCSFAIDDFGSGHTTFQNLLNINADIIKIDGSMVRDLSHSPHKQAFIRMMVDLADTFGVETVAEMVDSHADAALMQSMGVTYFQGYLFGKPSPEPRLKPASTAGKAV